MRGQGIEPILHDVTKQRPSAKELRALITLAKGKPSHVLRKRDKAYKALGFDKKPPTDAEALTAMAAHPGLIPRPIVVAGNRAAIVTNPEMLKSELSL